MGAIKRLELLTNVTELCSFLGLRNVFYHFVLNLVRMAAPFNNMLKKDQPKHFSALATEELSTMSKLRAKLVSPLILALPSARGKYYLYTDACNMQVGCVLHQK